MENKMFVGNLAFALTEDELRGVFEAIGPVESVNIVTDRDTGRSRGFAFVEMTSAEDVQTAIADLDGKEVGGRPIGVSVAKPKREGGGGGGRSRRF